MSKQIKKFSLTSVNKQHKDEYSSLKRETLSNGDYLDYKVKFRKSEIQRLILDYQDILEQLKKLEVSSETARDVTFIYYMLLLKHFTSLDNIPADAVKMVHLCEKLVDLNLLEELLIHIPKDQMNILNVELQKVTENSDLIGREVGELFVKNFQMVN